jgi:hypothetical protein
MNRETPAPVPQPGTAEPKFVAIGTGIMMGAVCVATAASRNMALRIARALNLYKTDRRGR